MAIVMTYERRAAAKSLGRELRRLQTGKHRDSASYKPLSRRPVILALEDELWSTVVKRIHGHSPPVLLAVYYPDRGSIRLFRISSAPAPDEDESSRTERPVAMEQEANTTVGQVIGPPKQPFSVPVDGWTAVGVAELAGV